MDGGGIPAARGGLEREGGSHLRGRRPRGPAPKIPAVCDEGGYFYPPLGSKFELRPPGTDMFDLQVDLAIKHGYWGMMPTTYCGAEHPMWDNVEWLRTINGRFQSGKLRA